MEKYDSKKKKIKYVTSQKPLTNHLFLRNKILKNAEEKMGFNNLLKNKTNLDYKINHQENTNFNFQNNFETSMPNLNNLHNYNSFYSKNFNINNHTLYNGSFSNNKNKIINNNTNLGKYYKKLYLKTKNENSMLLKERKQLINKNEINEQTIIDLIKDKRELIKNNEKLEKTIEEYKKIINEKDRKKEAEKNYTINNSKLVKDNESLYNKINELIQDNSELRRKLKEMNSSKIINNKSAIQQYNSFNSKAMHKISNSNINDNNNNIPHLRNNSSKYNNKPKDVLEIKPNLNKINIKMRNAKKLIQANRSNSTNNTNTNTNKTLSRENLKKRTKINNNIGIDVNIDNLFYSQIIQTDKKEKNNIGDNYYKNGEIYNIKTNKDIDYEKKYNEINYEYNKLIKEISNIKKSISIINNKNKNFQKKINELQEINNNLKNINSKQKEEIENLNKKYNIKNEINNNMDEPNDKNLDLPRQINNLNEIKQYNFKNNNYINNKDKNNVNNLDKLDINEKNKNKNDINISQYKELKLYNDNLSKKVSELTQNIIEKDKMINSLKILEEKSKEDNRKLSLAQNELKNLKNKNNSGKSLDDKKELELKILEMKKNNDSLKYKINDIMKENKKLKDNGDKLVKENNELIKLNKAYTNNKIVKENNEEINKKQIELLNEEIKNLKKFQSKYINTEHENVLLKQKNNEIITKYELLKNKIEDENKNKSTRTDNTKLKICSNINFKLTSINKESNINNNFEDLLCRPSIDINQQMPFNDNISKLLSQIKPIKEVEINIIQGKNDSSGKKIRKRKVKIIEPFEMKENQEKKEDKKEEKENKDIKSLLNDTKDKIKDKYYKLKNNYNILLAENKNLIKENEKLSEKNNILELMINNEEDCSSKSEKNVYRIKNKIDNIIANKNEIENKDNINNISSLKEINQKLQSKINTLQKEKLRFEEKLLNLQQLLNSELEKEKNVITKLRQSQDLSSVQRTSYLIDNIPEQEKEAKLINDNENSQNLIQENKCLKEIITHLKLEISEFKKEQNYNTNKYNIVNKINCDNDSNLNLINEIKKENDKLKKENFIYFKEIQSLNNYIMRLEKNMGIDNEINKLKLVNIEQNKLIMNLSQQIKEYQSKVDNIIIGKSPEEKDEQIKILINEVKGVRKRILNIITFEGRIKEMDELIDILNEIKGEIKESKSNKIKGGYEKLSELINNYQMNNDKFYNDIILQRLRLKDNYENVNISKK